MPHFQYHATDAEGVPRRGQLEAAGRAEALAQLEQGGWTVLEVEVADAADAKPRSALRADEARWLVDQLASLTGAELPLGPGLRALALEMARGRLRSLVLDLAARVESGQSLPDALDAQRRWLPGHLRGLLLAASRSGRAGALLGDFVAYAQVGSSLRRSLWIWLAYPVLLLVCFLTIAVLMCIYIVSGFEVIFADFGVNVPLVTRVVFRASHTIAAQGPRMLALPWVFALVGWAAGRLLLDRASRRRLLYALPLFGPLWRLTAMAEFSHFLGLLTEAELPLGTALPLAAEGTGDVALQESSEVMKRAINSGATLAGAARLATGLPAGFARVLGWAEGYQSLPETLHMAGEIFEAHARTRATFVGAVVSVLTVILILWGVVMMALALFLPMFRLLSALS